MEARKQNIKYSRADLLSLRYEGKSRQRPQCSNRVELQTLHFWKVALNAVAASSSSLASCSTYANQSKNRLSPETDNSSLNSSNNGSISSRRAMRNRERANNYYQRFVPSIGGDPLPICGEEKEKSFKCPSIIDHRSISSSHLMPAFAKRRFAAVNSGNGSDATQNTCDDLNGQELIDRVASPQLTKASTTTSSPQSWKVSGSDSENPDRIETEKRLQHVQLDSQVPQCSSPTFSSRLERHRIGSGRLLVNSWEYNKSQKARESSLDIEKETSFNGNNRHRTHSGRVSENIDRRFQYDNNKKHTDNRQNIVSNRRNNNKEALNSRGKRLNTYHNDRNEEPEWFSAGPTSQLETIDLHGFDDLENNGNDNKGDEEEVRNQLKTSENSIDKNLDIMQEIDACSSEDKNDTKEKQNKNQSNSGTQFNFDAFLNMHPLDPTLLSNDEIGKDEIKGTSRFSRWFRGKDVTNNTEPLPAYQEPLHIQEKHGIPSVKDLEAQMTKVDMRPSDFQRADDQRVAPVPVPFSQIMPMEKPVVRDTEAFKKLLQQLGNSHVHLQVRQQPSNLCANDGSFQLINNLSPELPVEPIRQTGHRVPQQLLNMNTSNSAVSEIEYKRMEMQQLMQNLNRGDISVELLEKELHNPNTPPHSKEMIVSVIREYRQHTKGSPVAAIHSDPHLVVTHNLAFQQHEDLIHLSPPNHHGINQQLNSGHSHGHNNSQTPLAFTPTSVLRKMTADKDTSSQIQSSSHNQPLSQQFQLSPQQHVKQQEPPTTTVQQQQPRMILGGGGNFALGPNPQQIPPNLQQQCRSNQNPIVKWNSGVANMQMMLGKSFGRPILKGGPNSLPQIQIPAVASLNQKIELQQHLQQNQQHQQQMQQQQQLRFKTSVESNLISDSLHQNIHFPNGFPQHNFQQQHNLLMHHQQQRQSLRPRVIYGELHQQHQHHHQPNFPMASTPLLTSDFHDLSGESGNVVKNNSFHRDERMPSPPPSTNNQLAQWFSPELLAKASAGKLPHLNQSQALSLEEFERSIQHSSAVVHN